MQPACVLGVGIALELCPTYSFWLEAKRRVRSFIGVPSPRTRCHQCAAVGVSALSRDSRQTTGLYPAVENEHAAGWLVGLSSRIGGTISWISTVTDKYYYQVISYRQGLEACRLCHACQGAASGVACDH
jgi:hypothetical protein